MNYEEESLAEVVAGLDHLAQAPTDVLAGLVARRGVCLWINAATDEPEWTGDARADRALVAPLCASCPVRRECLEWEFRTTGGAKLDEWGLLDEVEHEAAHLAWLLRRRGGLQ
ncbi:WhiB family transcriptional regulator [Prauserella cavernicola]|uniref:WhiB family transcriptional regulator n=1 Tax=Prauserella cavernicola TaxID=2800127 RepID=A0A934QS80_9PSEU|nr:WhiB family transcriptional regulator [Prauserella cavernicola]MBK1784448.1 WhiB family transcriptional regulator [Prauserella cavernicola]